METYRGTVEIECKGDMKHVVDQAGSWHALDNIADLCRLDITNSDSSMASATKWRKVSLAAYQKWKSELDKDCHTMSWLECVTGEVGARKMVDKVKCKVCIQFRSMIVSRRNYSEKCVSSADSI